MTKNVKEQIHEIEIKEDENIDRSNLNIQQFMDDMSSLRDQTQDKDLRKVTAFNYGDGTITNYLLWLLLGEIMILNDKLNEES